MTYEELLAMAGGDEALAKAVRAALERLRDGEGGNEMREVAKDVLDGRISLREMATSDVYGDALRERLRKLAEWREEVGEEEYQRQVEKTRSQLDELRESMRWTKDH
jgi:hypothetical protein